MVKRMARPGINVAAVRRCAAFVICALAWFPTASEAAIGPRPCDIYARGGTPCVAAHSSTRALYARYRGPLYEVRRASDGRRLRIVTRTDGYAGAAAQDAFCANDTCTITRLFDQSPKGNDLSIAGPGGNGGQNRGVVAGRLPVWLAGRKVYGMSFEGGMGYRDNQTSGVATGSQPESMYMITSGTHFNNECCFDYGNAETSSLDTGNGHMDAIYFGASCWFAPTACNGSGPWVQADLENGLFLSDEGKSKSPSYTGNRTPFVTAMLKNDGVDVFALKNADARRGPLDTHWSGSLPKRDVPDNEVTIPWAPNGPGPTTIGPRFAGYSPMKKEGAIILGTGGDNSNTAVGSFFEGVMTAGYAGDATERAVQANVVKAGYRTARLARPRIGLSLYKLRPGVLVSASCAGACTLRGRVRLSRVLSRRLGLSFRTVRRFTRSVTGSGTFAVRLPARLVRRARFEHLTRLPLTVIVTAAGPDDRLTTWTRLVRDSLPRAIVVAPR